MERHLARIGCRGVRPTIFAWRCGGGRRRWLRAARSAPSRGWRCTNHKRRGNVGQTDLNDQRCGLQRGKTRRKRPKPGNSRERHVVPKVLRRVASVRQQRSSTPRERKGGCGLRPPKLRGAAEGSWRQGL